MESFPSRNVILYCEIYGDGVQDLKYGHEKGHKEFRAFDMIVDDRFIDHDEFVSLCETHKIPIVPTLYRGPWETNLLSLAGGGTQLANDQIREGIVIKPGAERWHDEVGRVILKCISDEYLVRKGGSEKH